jgi:lipopolysaccharide transport system permease protein
MDLQETHKQSNKFKTRAVYTPESQVRHPLKLLRAMWQDLLGSRELAWQLLKRNISAQYRQSVLGVAWAVIPSVVTASVFAFARKNGVVNIAETDLPYPAYVLFSTALWQTFVEALNGPVLAVAQAKQMLVRINFPREALILTKLGEVFFNFGFKLILILGAFIWFQMPVSWSALLAPVALLHLVFLGTAIGVFLAPMSAIYQDFAKGLTVVATLWMFLTPVVYPTPKGGGFFGTLVEFNPATPLLVTVRELTTTGIVSNPQGFWIASAIAIVGLLLAWLFYRLAMPFVVERMSS